jgi:hypothetical protein
MSTALTLAARALYEADWNKVKPKWDDLTPGGACQQAWIERAMEAALLMPLPPRSEPVERVCPQCPHGRGFHCSQCWPKRRQAEEDAAHAMMREADDAWARDNWPPTAEEIDRTYFASRDAGD